MDSLFAAKIAFSGLNRNVSQQKLNLFQLSPGSVAEPGTRLAEVVRRQFGKTNAVRSFFYDVPHGLFSDSFAP